MKSKNKKRTGVIKSTFEILCASLQKNRFRKISATEFLEMVKTEKDITIIDCRDEHDYAEGHVTGAINIPYQNFMKNWQKYLDTKRVITVCYLGYYSCAAAQKIARSNNHTVFSVIGGMEAVNKLK
jgi:rhodanese-related sulfurtransferase